MKHSYCLLIAILLGLTLSTNGQFGNVINKAKEAAKPNRETTTTSAQTSAANPAPTPETGGYSDDQFVFMGRNEMAGKTISAMRACVVGGNDQAPPPVAKGFVAWIRDISETAALRSFNSNSCQIVAFRLDPHPAYKYKNIDALDETAQGNSLYKIEVGKLVLVKAVAASEFYIVVVPDHNKPGLKLADLRMCGYPDTIKQFRRKVNSVSNCHDQKQKLYVFEKYKQYPGPMQTSSVIFDAAEFDQLNKQGKFRGLVIYKLVGEELVAAK